MYPDDSRAAGCCAIGSGHAERSSHPRRLHLGLDLLKQIPVPDGDSRLWDAAAIHPAILPDGADNVP